MSNKRNQGAAARMRDSYGAGDFKAARAAAWELLHDPSASDAEKDEALRLRQSTEVDRRALWIALGALGLATFVILVFIL
jgi:hypothetical protein